MSRASRIISDKTLGFYPDILHDSGEPWTVHECEPQLARVNLRDRVGYVPEALTEIDRNIQNHEYGHVKITDMGRERGTTYGEFQYFLEECRVNVWLMRHNIAVNKAYDGFNWVTMPRPDNEIHAALSWLQCVTYRDGRVHVPIDLSEFVIYCARSIAADKYVKLCAAYAELKAGNLKRAHRDELARKLADEFTRIEPPPEKPQVLKQDYDQERKEEKEAQEKAAEKAEQRENDEPGKLKGDAQKLGAMAIHRHITKNKPGRRIAMPFGSSETGMIPTQFGRRSIDGKMFKRKKATGAVIIDMSGSMRWDWAQLRDLIRRLPNVTIAGYHGVNSADGKYDAGPVRGKLCVFGEKGRWSEPEYEAGDNNGNDVDFEALDWGAKVTDGPVVWLSDGEVCGGVYRERGLVQKCNALMKKRGIVRLTNADDARAYFRKKPVTIYTRCDKDSGRVGRMK